MTTPRESEELTRVGSGTPIEQIASNTVPTALNPLGVKDIEMPVTSERVWRAIQAGAA